MALVAPDTGDDWVALSQYALPVASALEWVQRPDCGAIVLFSGTVRDHAEGRPGVTSLEYEAFEEQARGRLARVGAEARRRWPMLGRLGLLHRVGRLSVGECSVVVVVSAPHRAEAFEAGRFCIDTLKVTVPIWKHETWAGGSGWAVCSSPVEEVGVAGS